jgi:ATP phosphoribosyltransferase regulatory subunit
MAEQVPLRGQLPPGFQDLLLEEAACRRQAEADLRALFFRWAYTEVIPPTLEYVETLAAGSGASQHQAAYRFLDREGHLLALRTDFTPQVARLAAGRLSGRSLPLRCFYIGSVFRHEEPQAGRQREFTQAGVELLGAGTVAADAEVIALAVNTLEALHVPGFQLCLGQAGLFRALTAGLQPAEVDHIRNAMDRRNPDDLAAALEAAAVGGPRRALLAQLPEQVGGLEILAPFRALGGAVAAAAEALEQVYRALQGHGVADRVALDLGEVRGMEYYTGVTFRAGPWSGTAGAQRRALRWVGGTLWPAAACRRLWTGPRARPAAPGLPRARPGTGPACTGLHTLPLCRPGAPAAGAGPMRRGRRAGTRRRRPVGLCAAGRLPSGLALRRGGRAP